MLGSEPRRSFCDGAGEIETAIRGGAGASQPSLLSARPFANLYCFILAGGAFGRAL